MTKNTFELSVAVPSGSGRPTKIKEFGHRGLTYVEGRIGQPFVLLFKNNSANRVLAVPSVDGLCTVDGTPATDTSRGYVVSPYQVLEIKGWRTSLNDVAKFVFEGKDGTYAAQTVQETKNCGVIGVKVFDEVIKFVPPAPVEEHHHHHHHYPRPIAVPWSTPWRPYTGWPYNQPYYGDFWCSTGAGTSASSSTWSTDATGKLMSNVEDSGTMRCANQSDATLSMKASFHVEPSSDVGEADFNIGTGFGEQIQDIVGEVSFDRGNVIATLEIYYSDTYGLKKAGIELDKPVALSESKLPQAFNGFCRPPVAKAKAT